MNEPRVDRASDSFPFGDASRTAPPHGHPSVNRSIHRSLPRYKVVLHRHPSLELMFVVRSVMELTRYMRAEATHKMWESYHNGRSILLSTWLERAELYVEQFADKGLVTSIEPL